MDLIDRQAAIDAVTPFDDEYRIRDAIEDLPSAQPDLYWLQWMRKQNDNGHYPLTG